MQAIAPLRRKIRAIAFDMAVIALDQLTYLHNKVKELQEEVKRLHKENAQLRQMLGPCVDIAPPSSESPQPLPPSVTIQSPAHEKIALFRSLFRGREDVFAVRWERKDGKAGYSPACRNEWKTGLCRKPCAKCPNGEYLPLTDQVIADHLTGKQTVGVYALLPDETCWFLAVDFDRKSWQADAGAFLEACAVMKVPAALERSRSGNGGHVWIFFEQPIPAALARNLGATILTEAMDARYQLSFGSYDRFFPSQDTIPKGGWGNLIALPLQQAPRSHGNSVFVDHALEPYQDQWAFLSAIRKMQPSEAEIIVRKAMKEDRVFGVQVSPTEDDEEGAPWKLPPSGKRAETRVEGPMPEEVRLIRSNLVYIEKKGIPFALINRLMRLAAFQNPEFYQAQRLRLSTFGKPRIISCAEEFSNHIGLPRGCLTEAISLLDMHGIRTEPMDELNEGSRLGASFRGDLTPLQKEAAQAMLSHDIGTLSAATAFGKTVVAAWLIGARKVNTLVLVHRRQLMDQWRERLAAFLDIPPELIGQIGGGKFKPTGYLDVGVIQSLNQNGEVKDLVADYGQVIVDECHHISAFSFEQVLKKTKARYVLGLTATPIRKDGHHPIITMQCGPIRFQVDSRQSESGYLRRIVIPKKTGFALADGEELSIQEVYARLAEDSDRNNLIVSDIIKVVKAGGSPLVLTERTQHLEELTHRLEGHIHNLVVLRGGSGVKARQAAIDKLAAILDDEERVLLATGRYAGEGFDDARLDCLFLCLPVSWKGVLQQYAGRLHRMHDGKSEVVVYDYVDDGVPMLERMYRKRIKGYQSLGYEIQRNDERKPQSDMQECLWPDDRRQ